MDLTQRLTEAQVVNGDLLRQRTQLELQCESFHSRLDECNRVQLALEQQLKAKDVEFTELSELCRRLKTEMSDKETQLTQQFEEERRLCKEIEQIRSSSALAQQQVSNKLLLAEAQMRQDKRLVQELQDRLSRQDETIAQLKKLDSASQLEQLRAQLEKCTQSALEDKRRSESLLEASDVEFCALTKKCGDLELKIVGLEEEINTLRINLSTTQQCAAVAADTAQRDHAVLQERINEIASIAAIASASGVSELAMLRAELERRNADLAATQRFLDCAMQDTEALRQRHASELGAAQAEIADMREVLQNLPDLCLEACGFEESQITALNLCSEDKPSLRDLWTAAQQAKLSAVQRAQRLRRVCAKLTSQVNVDNDESLYDEDVCLTLFERCAEEHGSCASLWSTVQVNEENSVQRVERLRRICANWTLGGVHDDVEEPINEESCLTLLERCSNLSSRAVKSLAYIHAIQQRLVCLDCAPDGLLASMRITHLEQELAHLTLKCVLLFDDAELYDSARQLVNVVFVQQSQQHRLQACSELLSNSVVQATRKWLASTMSTLSKESRQSELINFLVDSASRQTLLSLDEASLLTKVAAVVQKTALVQLELYAAEESCIMQQHGCVGDDDSTLDTLTSQAETLTLKLAELLLLINPTTGGAEEHSSFVCSTSLDTLMPIFHVWARTALEQLFPAQLRCTATIFSDLRAAASECKLSFVDEDELLRTYLLSLSNKLVGQLLRAASADLEHVVDKRVLHDVVRNSLAGLADEITNCVANSASKLALQPLPDAIFNKQVRKSARAVALLSFCQYCVEETRVLPQQRHTRRHSRRSARQHDSGISLLGSPPPPATSLTDELDGREGSVLQQQQVQFEEEKAALQKKWRKKQTQLTDCQQHLAGAELLLADLRLEKSSVEEQFAQLQSKLHACEESSAESAERHRLDVEMAEERSRAQEERYRMLETSFAELKQQLHACEMRGAENAERHRIDVAKAEERARILEERYQLLEMTFIQVKQQSRESEGQLQELRKEAALPKEEHVQLIAKCDKLQKQLHTLQEDYEAELERQRVSHKRQICQLREENHAAAAVAVKDEAKVKHVATQALLSNLLEGDLNAVQVLCQASVDAVEGCQTNTLAKLNSWYRSQIEALREEKETALRAESQATQIVVDALRHTHKAELLSEKRRLEELVCTSYSQQEVDIFLEQYRLELALIRDQMALLAEQLVHLATTTTSTSAKLNSPNLRLDDVISRLTEAVQHFANSGKEPASGLVAVLQARLLRLQRQMALLRLRFAEHENDNDEVINSVPSIEAVELTEIGVQTQQEDVMPAIADAAKLDHVIESAQAVTMENELANEDKSSSQESLLETGSPNEQQEDADLTPEAVANENMKIDDNDVDWQLTFPITSQVPLSHFYLGETVPLSDSSNKSASSHHLNEERPVICTQATPVYRRKRDSIGSEGGGKNRPKSTLF